MSGDHLDLPVLTHSFPTRRSSDLAYVRQHRWRLALATLSEMYDELPDGDEASVATSGVDGNSPALQTWIQHDMAAVTRTKAMVLLRMARIFLQIGDRKSTRLNSSH